MLKRVVVKSFIFCSDAALESELNNLASKLFQYVIVSVSIDECPYDVCQKRATVIFQIHWRWYSSK